MTQEQSANQVVVLAGPSAVGKSTVVNKLRDIVPHLFFSVSMTTRDPRPGEEHGRDYLYISRDEFESNIDSDLMLEWAEIHGGLQLSGTPRRPVEEAMDGGRPVLIEVDLVGARNVKKLLPQAHTVFLAPPSWEVLVDRLTGRGTESEDVIQRRLETAKEELASKNEFDHVVVNDDVEHAAEEIKNILLGKN